MPGLGLERPGRRQQPDPRPDVELDGYGSNETLIGGAGDDLLVAGSGANSLVGGPGNDTLVSNRGDDSLFGGAATTSSGSTPAPTRS